MFNSPFPVMESAAHSTRGGRGRGGGGGNSNKNRRSGTRGGNIHSGVQRPSSLPSAFDSSRAAEIQGMRTGSGSGSFSFGQINGSSNSNNSNSNIFGNNNNNNNNNNNVQNHIFTNAVNNVGGYQGAFAKSAVNFMGNMTSKNNSINTNTSNNNINNNDVKNKQWKRNTKRLPDSLSFDAKQNYDNDEDITASVEDSILAAFPRKKQTTKADRAARFGTTSKTTVYEDMKQNRIEQRQLAIQKGLIPDPNAPTRLEDAIDFRGTCITMCPEFEMVERELQNGLDTLEMDEQGNLDPSKAVKTYRRSAAGNEQPLPCDVRPPDVLIKTLDYLMGSILDHQPLEKCHPFLRDRTRSIRQDFTLQNIRDRKAVEAHERIARFHILCLHEMCELDEERFSEQQETEQLRKVLLSLMEFYEDLREEGVEMENEAEFRAYHLISHIRDPDAVRQIQTLPPHLFRHPYIQRAIQFYGLMQRNNEIKETSSRRNKPANVETSQNYFSAFFKLVGDSDTPFLMACMLEWHFPDVRKGALKSMNAAYRQMGVGVQYIRQVLGYDTIDAVIEEAQVYGLTVDTTAVEPLIRFHQKYTSKKGTFFIEPLSNPKHRRSLSLVEPKKGNASLCDIVNGVNRIFTGKLSVPTATMSPSLPTIHTANSAQQYTYSIRQPGPISSHFDASTDLDQSKFMLQQQKRQQQQEQQKQEQQRRLAEQMKQRQHEIDVQLRAQQAEIERREAAIRQTKERQRLEQERVEKQREVERLAAAAEEALLEKERRENEAKKQREKEIRDKELARQRQAVIISQAKKRLVAQLTTSVLKQLCGDLTDSMRERKLIAKRYGLPWLQRARQRIALRQAKLAERIQFYRFSNYFHTGSQFDSNLGASSTTYRSPMDINQIIQEKASLSLQLESSVLASYQSTSVNTRELWKPNDYAESIYALVRSKYDRIRSRMVEDSKQPGWQLWIHIENRTLSSSGWYKSRFDLDDTFSRRTKYYSDCRITVRSVVNEDDIYGKAVDELGAVIFSLSELREHHDWDDINATDHWLREKERLVKFCSKLKQYNPQIRVPFVFSYWPDTKYLEDMVIKIPYLLDITNNDVISDFHILVMNRATIKERMDQEIYWLCKNTVINQPLKTTHNITSKIRALTFAMEKASCHLKIGVTIGEAIEMTNKQIQAYNETLVEIPLNWEPFILPPLPEQPISNREATKSDFFVIGNNWLETVAKKGIVECVGGTENLSAVVDGTMKQHIYELERRLKSHMNICS